jgi:hypothetical protein
MQQTGMEREELLAALSENGYPTGIHDQGRDGDDPRSLI